jgi:hypothetical protein
MHYNPKAPVNFGILVWAGVLSPQQGKGSVDVSQHLGTEQCHAIIDNTAPAAVLNVHNLPLSVCVSNQTRHSTLKSLLF